MLFCFFLNCISDIIVNTMLISGKVKIFASDFEESLCFYTEIMGCVLKEKIGRVFAQLEKSGLTIELYPFPVDGSSFQQSSSIGIGSSDFDAVLQKLRENRIQFSRFKDEGESRIISLYDPDDVLIYLRETA